MAHNGSKLKKVKFQEANTVCGYKFVSNVENVIMMKYKISIKNRLKVLFGCPLWIAAPIKVGKEAGGEFIPAICRHGFKKGNTNGE